MRTVLEYQFMLRHLTSTLTLCLLVIVPPLLAQTDARITGWYDGTPVDDGVTHGTGYIGVGPLWPTWLAPSAALPHRRYA